MLNLPVTGKKVSPGYCWLYVRLPRRVLDSVPMSWCLAMLFVGLQPSWPKEWSTKQPPENVLDDVSGFRYLLYQACAAVRKALAKSQCKIQRLFNWKGVARFLETEDQVVALMPIMSSPFQAHFAGPYGNVKCLSDQNYSISTPDPKKKVQVCHINLLKAYFSPVPVGLITPFLCPFTRGSLVALSTLEKGKDGCICHMSAW